MAGPKNELPCPCGSGTRHDECCGPIRRSALERYTDDDLRQALVLADRELERPEYEPLHASVGRAYFDEWLDAYEEFDADDELEADVHEAHALAFMSWVLFDCELPDGSRVAERLLERRGEKLPRGVRNALSALCASVPRLYSIEALRPDEGFVLEDLASGERMWAGEPGAGASEDEGDVLLARLVRDGRGERTLMPDARHFPAGWKDELRAEVERQRAVLPDLAPADEVGFWKRNGPLLHQTWCQFVYGADEAGAAGIELERTTYRILDAEALAARLSASEDFHLAEEDTWEWLGAAGEGAAASGSLKREENELFLVTLVREAHDELRARVEELLAGVIEYVATETLDLGSGLGSGLGTAEAPEEREERDA